MGAERSVIDSTGIPVDLEKCELPATIKHPKRAGREHDVERCWRLIHDGMSFGFAWCFRKVGKTNVSWRGCSDRTHDVLGDFANREAAIGAIVIDALRRNERFANLTIEDRKELLRPSPKHQRNEAFKRLVSDLGGGVEMRKVAEMMKANREAIDRWCLSMMQVDERVKLAASKRDNLHKQTKTLPVLKDSKKT